MAGRNQAPWREPKRGQKSQGGCCENDTMTAMTEMTAKSLSVDATFSFRPGNGSLSVYHYTPRGEEKDFAAGGLEISAPKHSMGRV
jgi:hypothetical protein